MELSKPKNQYEVLFEANPQPMWVYDLETLKFLAVNYAAIKYYGYSREEFLNMTIKDIRPEDEVPLLMTNISLTFEKLERSKNWKHKKKDGSIIIVEIQSHKLSFEGKPSRLVLANDITKAKGIEEDLRENQRKLSILMNNLPGMAYHCYNDKSRTMEFVSDGCFELTGYYPNDLIRNKKISYNDLIHPDERKYVFDEIRKALNKREAFQFTYRVITANNETKWIWEKGIGIYSSKGVLSIEGFISDITSQKKIEIELIASKEKAEEMNRLKTIFLANMSHELRTPMIGILGYAESLYNELDKPEYKEMAYTLLKSGNRLKDTLDSILDLSRIEADKMEMIFDKINLSEVLTDVLKTYKKAADEKLLKLKILINDANISANLDKRMFIQILDNLINNAIKFTANGIITAEINRAVEEGKETAVISISDTGVGIPEDSFVKIFEPFRQESEGFARSYEGTGLGLTISKKFVELMNGRINVESILSKGSKFTIIFPALKEDEQPLDKTKVHKKSFPENQLPLVLLVENDLPTIGIIKLFLQDICKVDVSKDGRTAIHMAKEKKYDAILMDIDLGFGIDGLETTRQIKKLGQYKDTSIVAVTAYAMAGDKEKFLAEGCTHYLSKPFDKRALGILMNKILKI